MEVGAKRRREGGVGDTAEIPDAEPVQVEPKKLIRQLERNVNKNLELRAKFAAEPEKFVDSEVDLDEAIQQLGALAAQPESYRDLVRLGSLNTIITLLAHENVDICVDTINLLNDLLSEAGPEKEEDVLHLADSFLAINGHEALADALVRFGDGDDGATAIYNILSIYESLVEMKPDLSLKLMKTTKLRSFLMRLIGKDRPYDSNKQYGAELLAILTQSDRTCQTLAFEDTGLETILESIGTMRRDDAQSEEQKEMILDLFNVLCSCLSSHDSNKAMFLELEGINLVLLLVRKRKWLRPQCFKVLDFALGGRKDGCDQFIASGGLGVLFSVLMNVKGKQASQMEEYILSISSELLRRAEPNLRVRVIYKWKENSYEKLWRVVSIFAELHKDLKRFADEDYAEKLGEGGYRELLAALCIGQVCKEDSEATAAAIEMLRETETTLSDVVATIELARDNIDPETDPRGELKEYYDGIIHTLRDALRAGTEEVAS